MNNMAQDIIYMGADFEIKLDTETDVSAMTTKEIHFRKPNSKALYKRTASLVGTDYLKIDISHTTNNMVGDWKFRSYVKDAVGKIYKGVFVIVTIHDDWRS